MIVLVIVVVMVVVEVMLLLLFYRWEELEMGNDLKVTQLVSGRISVKSRPMFSKSSALA